MVAQFGSLNRPEVDDFLKEVGFLDMIERTPIYNPGKPADGGWLENDNINSLLSVIFHDSF